MSLQDRIETLRRQIGAVQGAPPGRRTGDGVAPGPDEDGRTDGQSLADRLQRLRGGRAGAPSTPALRPDPARLAELVDGEILAPGVILAERRLPLATRHGAIPLGRAADPVRGLPEGAVDPRGAVYLDTETTGLSGGTGTVVFLLGIGRVEGDDFVVRQYLLSAFAGEADLLAAAGEWVAAAERVVTYNGRSFDLPLVAARCRLAGVEDRFSRLAHVDLLHHARRAFATRWEDCRLCTAERRLLRFEREDDLPGSEAPDSWFAFIHRGDAARLPLVADHNYRDIVSLAALLPALADAHAEPGAWEADILAVARAHARAGAVDRAYLVLREHRAMLDADGLLELAAMHRRRRDWAAARGVWEELAARGHTEAVERLAKYHEHVRRDFAAALALAERLPAGPKHERRRARLRRRLPKGAPAAGGAPGPRRRGSDD